MLMVGLGLAPLRLLAQAPAKSGKATASRGKSHSKKKRALKKSAVRRSSHRKDSKKVSRKVSRTSARNKQRVSRRRRLAQLHIERARAEEIQGALIKAGYLNEEPSGNWDNQTRDAMRRYQADHGFPVTGLPEAKSLMKLGLGPHPLPEGLDTSAVAQASAGAASKADPTSDSTPQKDSPAADPPHEN